MADGGRPADAATLLLLLLLLPLMPLSITLANACC